MTSLDPGSYTIQYKDQDLFNSRFERFYGPHVLLGFLTTATILSNVWAPQECHAGCEAGGLAAQKRIVGQAEGRERRCVTSKTVRVGAKLSSRADVARSELKQRGALGPRQLLCPATLALGRMARRV